MAARPAVSSQIEGMTRTSRVFVLGSKFLAGEEAGDADEFLCVGAPDQLFDLRTLRAIADENKFEIAALLTQSLSCIEQNGDSLLWDQAADVSKRIVGDWVDVLAGSGRGVGSSGGSCRP